MAKTTKIIAGLGAGAIALTSAVLASPSAQAASDTTHWEDGNSRFEMTVSNTTPDVGDIITLSNTFQRKWSDEYIYNIKYVVPSCFDYVSGSAKWQGGAISAVQDGKNASPSFVRVEAPNSTSWRVVGLGGGFGDKRTASMQFRVTQACATGNAMGTTMHYGGSLGNGTYQGKGPSITVAKGSTPTTTTTNPTTSTTKPSTSTTNPTSSTTKPSSTTTNPTGSTNPTGTTDPTDPTGTTTPTKPVQPGGSGSMDLGSLGSLFG